MTTIQYDNGNCHVELNLADGTKHRWCDGEPKPDFPCSIDLKITESCDQGCAHCHESATPDGRHADLLATIALTDGLPAGVELALGGGNVAAYQKLKGLLGAMGARGLVCNLTLHVIHAIQFRKTLDRLRRERLVYGVGISGSTHANFIDQLAPGLIDRNTVLHYVAGINSPWDVIRISRSPCNVLILGYKRRGRGKDAYCEKVADNIGAWRYFIHAIMRKSNLSVSFDNLATEQLGIREIVGDEVWTGSYMGGDGEFSMFVDAVRMEYAASSADEVRLPLEGMTIREAFVELRATKEGE